MCGFITSLCLYKLVHCTDMNLTVNVVFFFFFPLLLLGLLSSPAAPLCLSSLLLP